MSKKREFVCQNCGKTVPANKDKCPHCGRFFKGVRCPKCFYVGETEDFTKGCPSCGYLGDESENNISDLKENTKKPKNIPSWFLMGAAIFLSLAVIILLVVLLRI